MIVTFFNASGIDFGNFLNAHLRSKKLSSNYLTSVVVNAPVFCVSYIPAIRIESRKRKTRRLSFQVYREKAAPV